MDVDDTAKLVQYLIMYEQGVGALQCTFERFCSVGRSRKRGEEESGGGGQGEFGSIRKHTEMCIEHSDMGSEEYRPMKHLVSYLRRYPSFSRYVLYIKHTWELLYCIFCLIQHRSIGDIDNLPES